MLDLRLNNEVFKLQCIKDAVCTIFIAFWYTITQKLSIILAMCI